MVNRYTRRRYLSRSLYRMKREYGVKIDFYSVSPTKDAITGRRTIDKTKYSVDRAISIPGIAVTKFLYDAGYTAASSNTTQAGEFNVEGHAFLIDEKDLAVAPELDWYIVHDNLKHQVKDIQLLDHVYIIRTTALQNQTFNQIHNANVHQFLGVSDAGETS